MSPLIALMLFGFMFVIALSLTLWAALTLGGGSHRAEDERHEVAYVPLGAPRPVWRSEENEASRAGGIERRSLPSSDLADGRRSTDQTERRTGLPAAVHSAPNAHVASGSVASGRVTGGSVASGRVAGGRFAVDSVATDTVSSDTVASGTVDSGQISADGNRSNDDFRGARARVTQRPNHDDAFERFLENDRD